MLLSVPLVPVWPDSQQGQRQVPVTHYHSHTPGQVGKAIAFDVMTGQETIGYIKAWIKLFAGLPVEFQRLTYQGAPMADKLTLADYNVPPGAVLKLRLQLWPGPQHPA